MHFFLLAWHKLLVTLSQRNRKEAHMYIDLTFALTMYLSSFWFFFFNSEQFLSFLWNICLFIWLHQISAVASRIFSCGMWTVNPWLWLVGFSSLTRDQTWAPCIGSVWNLSHWTTGEVPTWTMFQSKFGVQKLLIESLVFLESETFLRI